MARSSDTSSLHLNLRKQVPAQGQRREGHGGKHRQIQSDSEMRHSDERVAQAVDAVGKRVQTGPGPGSFNSVQSARVSVRYRGL